MRLAYGRQSGWGRYGPRPGSGMDRGARIIELQLGESGANSTTYIRNVCAAAVGLQAAVGHRACAACPTPTCFRRRTLHSACAALQLPSPAAARLSAAQSKGEREPPQKDSPQEHKDVVQEECASMQAKDPYGAEDCVNGGRGGPSAGRRCCEPWRHS